MGCPDPAGLSRLELQGCALSKTKLANPVSLDSVAVPIPAQGRSNCQVPVQFFTLMAVNANDLRKGMAILHNTDVCVVLEVTHRTPGNLRAFVQAILRSIKTGKSMDVRFASTEKVETVPLNSEKMEFSYKSGDDYVFVNPETYEEVTVNPDMLGDAKNFLVENGSVTMTFVEEKVVQIEMPASVILTVADAPEGLKGDSANNVQKLITLETGVQISAPLFIKTGEKIKVDTRSGKYMERA